MNQSVFIIINITGRFIWISSPQVQLLILISRSSFYLIYFNLYTMQIKLINYISLFHYFIIYSIIELIMRYQVFTFEYFDQVKKLIQKEYAKNAPIYKVFKIPVEQAYKDRQNLKFSQESGIIAIDESSNRVVGVILFTQFLDFADNVINKQNTVSQGTQYLRQSIKEVVLDYLKRYPNLKRGEICYNHSACTDQQYTNHKIMTNLRKQLYKLILKRGFKGSVGLTIEPKMLRIVDATVSKLSYYDWKKPYFNGIVPPKMTMIQTTLKKEINPKL